MYAYAWQNPLSYVDRLGLGPKTKGRGKGERGATGGSSGQRTGNKYKHCRDHPTNPKLIQCKHHQTGKWIDKPKPADWPGNAGVQEMTITIPKRNQDCPYCLSARDAALLALGTGIIILDIVTIPSGEGACGVAIIRYVLTRGPKYAF